ncbi:hypothetical protein [Halomarina rubra]|uniref:Uncharacterized protein n=1 Tax=Halomarina rubra TaxID=2071873 RepID=A0ABD6AT00_9EURY|nr:hypothetical protein [Halomarina rubra]
MTSKSELVDELGRIAKGHVVETGDVEETLAALDEVRERVRSVAGESP